MYLLIKADKLFESFFVYNDKTLNSNLIYPLYTVSTQYSAFNV